MDFLTQQNRLVAGANIPEAEQISAKGKNVLVIGGGDTGADCVGTSVRQGAKSIYQIELLEKTKAQMLSQNRDVTQAINNSRKLKEENQSLEQENQQLRMMFP